MTAGTDDYDEIVRVAQLYVDGFNDNDVSKFREAFHEDAWIFYIDAEGGPHKNLISENFEEWAPPPSSGIVGRIISGDTGGRCCLGPAQLRPQGQALWMNRLPQSSQDQRRPEDHEQERYSQQQVYLAGVHSGSGVEEPARTCSALARVSRRRWSAKWRISPLRAHSA